MFTRKHYRAIAEIMANGYNIDENTEFALPTLAERLADYFAADNPRFDRDKFIAACSD